MDKSTIITTNFHTLPLVTVRTSRQKISKNREDSTTTTQLDQNDIHGTLHKQQLNTCYSHSYFENMHRTFTKTEHLLGHKTSLKFKRTQVKSYKVCSLTKLKLN